MTKRQIAAQYAKALFGVALSDADPRLVGDELKGFATLVAEHPELKRILTSAAIPTQNKRSVVGELVKRSPVSPLLQEFLALVARNDHFTTFDEIAEAYEKRLLQHLQVVSADVSTAVPLSSADQTALARSLADLTGRPVVVSHEVDPSLIGGVVAKIGSTVYDGSVARQLERLRAELKSVG